MNNKQKILIIDDDPAILSLLVARLEKERFRVIAASSGPEGMLIALREKPDLIIFDIIMPYVDGLMIIKKIRAAGGWGNNVPLVAFTNLSSRENRHMVTALSHGIGFFTKAETSLDELIAAIHTKIKLN